VGKETEDEKEKEEQAAGKQWNSYPCAAEEEFEIG
jgi:hypothetical protein